MRQTVFLIITILFFMSGLSECPAQETPEEAYTRIRSLRRETGDPAQAAQEALEFLNNYPEKDIHRQKIHYEYAAALFQQEKFPDAKTAFLNLVADYKDTTLDKNSAEFMVDDAQYFAAMIEQTQGDKDIDKAIAGYKAVVENFPASNWRPNALLVLGDLSREKEKWSDSLDYYYRVVDQYPDDKNLAPTALFWVNRILANHVDNGQKKMVDPAYKDVERMDKKGDIVANIERVKQNYPESDKLPGMLQDYMVFLIWRPTKENMKELESTCYYIIEYYPDTKYASYAKEELIDTMSLSESEELHRLASELLDQETVASLTDEDMVRVTNLRYAKGRLFIKEKKYSKAREIFEQALEADPETVISFELRYKIGLCYYKEKNHEQARTIFLELADEFSDAPDSKSLCLFMTAVSYEEERNYEKALKLYEQLERDYPNLNVSIAAKEYAEDCRESLARKGE